MQKSVLEKINRFTRRDFTEDELYIFSVVLCDNDVDRDYECFTDESLEKLSELFMGKTGIFDHNPSASGQNARIFDTEIEEDPSRVTVYGGVYRCLKAKAYMVRTDENRDLISEIDAGIKKEVSISCRVGKRTCSICGCDREKTGCVHQKGKFYDGKLCYDMLSDITDAYEWSFVAVPAQVNAGVTKKFSDCRTTGSTSDRDAGAERELRREIKRLAYFTGGRTASDAVEISSRGMNFGELVNLRKSYEKLIRKSSGVRAELMPVEDKPEDTDDSAFSMK